MANSYTLAGTAKDRGLGQVDPRLVQIVAAAAARSPYQVQVFSGKRFGSAGGSRHNSGNALDIALIDPTNGQVIPNYKSSTGFPIYAEFAKVAREEQMRLAPDLAGAFRWGGGFSDKDFDLMHFDVKPGGGMAYWTWADGGKLTAAGEKAVPQFGAGWIYANGQRVRAPEGQYASLWGRGMLPAQDAQSAIASLIAPSGGPAVPDMPTAAMGYAPNLPGGEPPAPAMPQVASATPSMPTPPPSWAQGGGFPIDESLTGQSADSVLMGGPRLDPRRAGPATGMIGPDMGSMQSPEDVLAAGPRLRPGGAPDASMVPDPLSRLASGVTPPPPQSVAMRNPPMRPGGAPDAGMVPTPPSRASGLPNPRMRPDINDPSLSFNAPPYAGGGPTGGPPMPPGLPPMVAGRPEFPGAMPAASRAGDLSAAMGNAPPSFSPPTPAVTDPFKQSFDLANDMNTTRENTEWWTGDLRPQSSPPPMPAEARTKDDAFSPPQGPFFDSANPGLSLPPSWASGSFPAPPSPVGTVGAGSTGGEFFTPAMPMPQAPSDPLASRFDDAFAPGGGGQIMDLQSAFNNRNAPPTMNAQGGINEVFGAPPAPAAPPNLAIPFAEVPGFDPGRFAGSAPASAATVASPLPMPAMSRSDFDARFAGGSVVQPQVPTPGVTPGVVQGTMPMPGAMDIRSPAQAGGSTSAPPPLPKAPPSPRQTDTGAQRQKQGGFGRVLGGLLGGPLGALGGGLLGGGGGIFGGGGSSVFSPMGSAFSAPYMQPNGQMGQTNVQHVQSGNMNGTMWNRSNGGSVGYVTDPFTGAMIYSGSPTAF